jgi:antitoxin (DNA-binding transcriptional repressor) of toxin-antitoxin stability system
MATSPLGSFAATPPCRGGAKYRPRLRQSRFSTLSRLNSLAVSDLTDQTPGLRRAAVLRVDIKRACSSLSHLIERVAHGEDVVIERSGLPIARITRLSAPRSKRRLGRLDGQFRIPDDFNRPLPDEVARAFEVK